ncbi:MAG: flagellar biosynthesis protein FliQ [Firmicutes bacterium]|jgi:flagellar biosynthetic protein FliQ|nr:flagellar biosynthesis protein FliQ [Bacillota bacterium]
MTDGEAVRLGREALMMVLLVAGPVLGLGLITGLVVSIIQAVTQIQEQTLSFVPKILAALAAVALFGPWMLHKLVDYATELLTMMPRYVR